MAKNTCKLCSRRFASPRALAGHMRAHSIAAAKSQISSASSASTSFAAGGGGVDDDGDGKKKPSPIQVHALREKPKRRVRLAESSDFSDRESETTDYYSPDAKRSRDNDGSGDAEPVSSVSDGDTPVEDVALSLMMLSRDSWPAPPPPAYYSSYRADSDDEGDARRPAVVVAASAGAAQKRTRYECPACKKVFRSYQALGGHRASNVRGGRGGCCAPPPAAALQPLPECCEGGEEEDSKPQPYECPYCLLVFPSGQALGGHKRSHLCSAMAAAAASGAGLPIAMKSSGFIDLNLPAPFDDVEHSAVSDPSFLSPKPAGS
ncbi:hypothetical protein HU200_032764 [Digitaria exilis]|uniref:C2H2-type domain-containing protein n=1 Tax=Digitaria exilis TaxID=1010633 RepID=A0A835ENF8_9POAL|nr:hypothetical protein HU200_032764 [Digitaria exilis]